MSDPGTGAQFLAPINDISAALSTIAAAAQNLRQIVPVPATSTAAGAAGSFAADANYLYVCVATDSWRRVALLNF